MDINVAGNLLLNSDKLSWVLALVIAGLGFLLYKMHNGLSHFDLKDLLIDNETGKVSLTKFGQLVSLVISSWGFVHLVINNSLSEMYFTIYISVWSATSVLTKGVAAYKAKNNSEIT